MTIDIPCSILLVAKQVSDIPGWMLAIQQCLPKASIHTLSEGIKLREHLANQPRTIYGAETTPDLILIDCQMPCQQDYLCIRSIKSTPNFRRIPVLFFGGEHSSADVKHTYALGLSSFCFKPGDKKDLSLMLFDIFTYWFNIVSLPPKHAG